MTLAAEFKALHAAPGFIMPNAWDVGSALILAAAGFKAIATTSAGIAFSLGQQDYADDPRFLVSREEMFARIREIVEAVDIPVSADLEAGYGDSPEAVAETVRMAIEAGLAGCNIEDRIPCEARLYDESLACEHIAAARAAIDAAGSDFVLTARSDVLFLTPDDLKTTIRRANLYRAAGADCLFTPGVTDLPSITTLAANIDAPLNMVLGLNTANGSTADWFAAGVTRISLGGAIARAALGFVRDAAAELMRDGTARFAETQITQPELNALFARMRG